jgi:hypothetical protein
MATLKSSSFPHSIESFFHRATGTLETISEESKSLSPKDLPERLSLTPSNESRILSPSLSSTLRLMYLKHLPLPGRMRLCGVTSPSLGLTLHKRLLHNAKQSNMLILLHAMVQWPLLLRLAQCFLQRSHSFPDSRPMILSLSPSTLLLEAGARLPQTCRSVTPQTQVLESAVCICQLPHKFSGH